MTVIHKLKYNHHLALAKPLGRTLFQGLCCWYDSFSIDLVLPVPLHRQKFRERGFNQTCLLLWNWPQLAAENGIGFSAQIRTDVLVRTRRTASQTQLTRKERLRNVKNAFGLSAAETVADKRILVVDDVYTTGATVGECARVLKAGGARRVDILTVARVG